MAERQVGRDNVVIERTTHGQVVVNIKPVDFSKDGASEATLDRSRGDDGSVTIVITPRDGAPSTITEGSNE